ncbi:MAG: glutathione S-transferase [Rhodospirillaceae bacterium]|mgnify:CR=1 FL=1|nr:glutathione S-transferase [Rhodospirillaceae bacterium]|tara:strand:- start:8430 stop:9092 length:663 start_codon:yes stop_codon:yes gene_type:complete
MTDYPVLYSFRRCPYAMRARMALMKSGTVCELREVVLRDKPSEMIELSAKGTVPVLQLQGGEILDESLDVMRWALAANDPDSWLEANADLDALLDQLDGEFKDNLDRYKYFVRFPEHSQSYYREQGEKFLAELENRLAANEGKGLSAPRTTFADIAVFPFVRQFAFVDKAWFDVAPYTLLRAWFNRHLEGDLFLSVMKKYPAWKTGDDITLFGAADSKPQ